MVFLHQAICGLLKADDLELLTGRDYFKENED